jgi:hypothetical protein
MARGFKTILAGAVVTWAVALAGASQAQIPPKVSEVIERTKTARGDYAIYNWFRMHPQGRAASESWTAEFNAGRLHRVETAASRLIADCDAKTGQLLDLATGKITSGPEIAAQACGIDTNIKIDAAEWLGRQFTVLGAVDEIRLTGTPYIRTFAISDGGVIFASAYQYAGPGKASAFKTLSTFFSTAAPDPAMFTPASLSRSFVPDAMKAGPTGAKWDLDLTQ